MENYIIYYFITGLLWTTYWQSQINLTWGARIRYTLFWPITLMAWLIGFIDAFIKTFFGDEEM